MPSQGAATSWRRWLPGVANIAGYQRGWLRSDAQAGLSVAAYLVPQALAYGTLAGLPPSAGLWSALAPLAVYAVLGSSRQLSMGPESTTALMTAAVLGPLALRDVAQQAVYAAVLAVLVGSVCLMAGLVGLGFLSNLLSRPVLVGYLSGIAVVMVVSQLGRLVKVPTSGEDLVAQLRSLLAATAGPHWPTIVVSAATLATMAALRLWAPRWPAPLVALAGVTGAVAVVGAARHGIDVVGALSVGLPTMGISAIPAQAVRDLALPALGIAIVGFSDNVLTARAFAAKAGQEVDVAAELRALGVCNVAVGLTHGFPVSSSGSRTALAWLSGARTQVYSLMALVLVAATAVLGTRVIAAIPSAVLGALVVYAAVAMVDVREFLRLARFRRSEFVLAVITAVAVAVVGVLPGVLAAIALSILDLLRRLARAHDSVQGFVPGLPGMHDVDDYPEATVIPGLIVYRYDAPLCFANAEDFRRRALAAVDLAEPPVHWLVLNVEANVEVDMTALDALERLRTQLSSRGIVLVLARVKQDLREALQAAGVLDRIGADHLFPTLPTAVAAYRRAWEDDR